MNFLTSIKSLFPQKKDAAPVTSWRHGWHTILEARPGAWQRGEELSRGDLTCYPTLYGCLSRISQDIGKLPFVLKRLEGGIWRETHNPAWSPVLRDPNPYQTGQQFREAWILSKLLTGNTFVLKRRDNRAVVTDLYVLDPERVTPLISEAGRVFYRLNYQSANNLLPQSYPAEQLTIPASEIIHDRMNAFHHQLIGVPPLCAAVLAAGKNLKILRNSSKFFDNGANPGGLISGPAGLSEADAADLKKYWNENFQGDNTGKIAVIGADLKFAPFAFKAADSQLVEQMRYSDEQICQPFGVPPFKVGIGSVPAGLNVDSVNLMYYSDALSGHIESMESLLDKALSLPADWGIWLDTAPLFRMDEGKKAEVAAKLVGGGIETPNEARARFDLPPLDGGSTTYLQMQDLPLSQAKLNRSPNAVSEAQ